ncbi:MAG: FadR family transcriptional regulator [Deltaproteobacteria bacterium]|nr:FadR family transcriptional regulator [Deltaproteobacteria bacterium]
MNGRTQALDLLTSLLDGPEMAPGDRLPSERELARRFRISRNSLREAIRTLGERGLLRSKPRDGTYVLARPRSLEVLLSPELLSRRRTLEHIQEARLVLEPAVAELAARRACPEHIARLKILVCEQEMLTMSGRDDGPADAEFHLELARATGNPILVDILEAMDKIIAPCRSQDLRGGPRPVHSRKGHLRLIQAVEAGRPDLARQAMADHLMLMMNEMDLNLLRRADKESPS